VVIRATSVANFHNELKDDGILPEEWAYHGEYIFMFEMDATGRKITRIIEFSG
jgi:hypothetical protein